MRGRVVYYNIIEGCGSFQTENGEDLPFFRKVLPVGTFLKKGDSVEFDIVDSDTGPQVMNVRRFKS